MKHPKVLTILVAIVMLSAFIVAIGYDNLGRSVLQASVTNRTPEPPQLQVFSPEENRTYQTANVPLNIAANSATTKIIYSLDGAKNATVDENTIETTSLPYGVHSIMVYGFDGEGKVGDSRNVTFNVDIPYPPTLNLNTLQVQQIISYFDSRGLTVQLLDQSKPQNCINAGFVVVESMGDLADFAITKGINVIQEVVDPNYVGFCVDFYNSSCLPIVYTYSATVG